MKIVKNLYNEDVPQYENAAEQRAAIEAYLNGEVGSLTTLEIEYFRSIEEDPKGKRFAAYHAGMVASNVDPSYLAGMTFVFGEAILDIPHPITNYYLWRLEMDLITSEEYENYKENENEEC